jgi:DNA-binding response OmpR family regulator
VDAIVLDYQLGLLDGALVANEMKRVRPTIPIVMVADDLELPYDALNSIDALVTRADGAHFLWAAVHFVLNVKPAQNREGKRQGRTKLSLGLQDAPFSAIEWRNIRTGIVRF